MCVMSDGQTLGGQHQIGMLPAAPESHNLTGGAGGAGHEEQMSRRSNMLHLCRAVESRYPLEDVRRLKLFSGKGSSHAAVVARCTGGRNIPTSTNSVP